LVCSQNSVMVSKLGVAIVASGAYASKGRADRGEGQCTRGQAEIKRRSGGKQLKIWELFIDIKRRREGFWTF
jgi:hypothetical protein